MDDDEVRALGYTRVSPAEQADRGVGRGAQRAAITAEAERRGWQLEFLGDVGAGGRLPLRPGLTTALARLDAGAADVLVVSRLDRLFRSLADVGTLAQRARRGAWSLVCLDVGLDTTTPAGAFVADVVARTARDDTRPSARPRASAAPPRATAGMPLTGRPLAGRLGRPADVPPEVVARVVAERRAGRSLLAIARGLDADGVPTARGGLRWYPTTVSKLLQSQQARDL